MRALSGDLICKPGGGRLKNQGRALDEAVGGKNEVFLGLGAALLVLLFAATANADSINCTGGCTIITCNAEVCKVSYCNDSGCKEVGEYQNPHPENARDQSSSGVDSTETASSSVYGSAADSSGLNCGTQRCVVKTCNDVECQVIGFEKGQLVPLGSVKNSEAQINRLADQFIQGSRGDSEETN